MVSPEHSNWIGDLGVFIDDMPETTFSVSAWHPGLAHSPFAIPRLNPSNNHSADVEASIADSETRKDSGCKKRGRTEGGSSTSKACREKLRRDRLNDKFLELSAILDPGRAPNTDKAAILVDAVKMVNQMRGEVQKYKNVNSGLVDKIKELKAEKNELRDEKQRLKIEKEKLEQQMKAIATQHTFLAPPTAIPAPFPPQAQPSGNKLVPFIGYPGVAMWQFMPPATVDTSQDHALRPPVA